MGEEVCCILWKTVKKNPAKQDSPPAAGRVSDILPQCDPRGAFIIVWKRSFLYDNKAGLLAGLQCTRK